MIEFILPLPSLRNQRIKKVHEGFVRLYKDHMHYKAKFSAEEPIDSDDKARGWEIVQTSWERVVPIRNVSAVELEFIQATEANGNEDNKWRVAIGCEGIADDIGCYFMKEAEARPLFEAVAKWILS